MMTDNDKAVLNCSDRCEIENYPHLVCIISSWWCSTACSHREYWQKWDYLHGLSLGLAVLGRFEMSDEIDFLKKVLEKKISLNYINERGLKHFER